MKVFYILLFFISLPSYADSCKIPSRLKADIIINDVVGNILNHKSVTGKILSDMSYSSFTDYSYDNDEYSKAIFEISKNIKILGSKYKTTLERIISSKEKEDRVNNAFSNLKNKCSNDDIIEIISNDIKLVLSGKENKINMELLQVNMHAISSMYTKS
jgi:hypothetical protein